MFQLSESGTLSHHPSLLRCVFAYHWIEELTALLILFMLLFAPWAFGTTQPWSIWTMNTAGYVLGALLLLKLAIRRLRSPLISKASSSSSAGWMLPRTLAV